MVVERFVGGGFAGQVYKVRLTEAGGPVPDLQIGGTYALKVLVPPSGFSRLFRNLLYWVGFQGPFQHQVNPAAARAGALWQKLIRRAARIRFGDERAVADIHATLVDEGLGSCGEVREWVEGRTWRLEVDDRLDLLRRWGRGRPVDPAGLGSPEYRAKRTFMRDFVVLLHEMGACELARQYEWSTCKSQPNCLKRSESEADPAEGLVAVDFRAGLVLLPLLPMSPGDVILIGRGVLRGSLVQFDRGNMGRLRAFVQGHREDFTDLEPILKELEIVEPIYRDSIPDITHNHLRLLYSSRLWSTMCDSAVTGWQVRGLIDPSAEIRLRQSRVASIPFALIGLVPILGKVIRRTLGHAAWRRHYAAIVTSPAYLLRALRAKVLEQVTVWHRTGRVREDRARRITAQPWRYAGHLPLSILPAGLHRFLTDGAYARDRLSYILVRPIRLYFNAGMREQWLRDMVAEGQRKHMLTEDDASTILSQIGEPFIQKYLKCLAVHLATLPMTEITALIFAVVYVMVNPQMSKAEAWTHAVAIVAVFQIVPVSPGSLVRGLYVLYVMIRERNTKDYSIALLVGFFRYIGYLGFPIQMAYRYPALARFMAGHWATEAVHVVPVFGEQGALLEHTVFNLFYNWPLTIRGRIGRRDRRQASQRPRSWHVVAIAAVAAGVLIAVDRFCVGRTGLQPGLGQVWWVLVLLAVGGGALATMGAGGGRTLGRRVLLAVVCGLAAVGLYGLASGMAGLVGQVSAGPSWTGLVWRAFIAAVVSAFAAIVTEMAWPEPTALGPLGPGKMDQE